MTADPKLPTMTEVLRKAIAESPVSINSLATEAGISKSQLSRFMSTAPKQRRDIRLETADRLANVLGLVLGPAKFDSDSGDATA